MVWTSNHDNLLLREILANRPWMFKKGSPERKQVWDTVAAVLNSLEDPYFQVNARLVRGRYNLLVKKYRSKISEENKTSGISPDISENDEALADLIERFNEADEVREKETENKTNKQAEDIAKAQEMRRQSLETCGESRKRNSVKGGTELNQKRSKEFDPRE